ncbi:MAG: DinB family protein [Gemmatimonadetes bacterium]|nr:MAG: DinB family protein [Gemmatimonadota bacterium]
MTDPQPPEAAPEGFGFWTNQLTLLGERDPMEVLAATVPALRAALAGADPDAWRRPRTEGGWSPVQILGHLLDVEWIFGYRIRTILADEEPRFGGVDQDRWVTAQRHGDADPDALLGALEALRTANLAWWAERTAEELERTGLHEGAGVQVSLGLMRRILAGHDLNHLAQVEQALAGA